MAVNLTRNAISAINDGDVNLKPLVQVLDIRQIGNNQERYRLILSDGVMSQHAMIATQLNDRMKAGLVRQGSVIQLIDYICSSVQGRKIIVVLNMETIMLDCETIGNQQKFGSAELTLAKPLQGADKMQSVWPTVQPSFQPPSNYKHHGPIMKNDAPARIIPIAALNPYQGRWAIKARVTSKSDIRRYNNARGDGKVFSFDLLDSDGGEIRATCFNAVLERFYDAVVVGKVYVISKGSLKPVQKNYNHLKNEWEILLESSSSVDICPDEDESIPQQQFTFRAIAEVEKAENNSVLDVIGIVTSINPSVTILRKNGMETQRRILKLRDVSAYSIELTLWGDFCNNEGQRLQELVDSGNFPILAVKAAKVNDFSGKSVGTISSTQLFINPDIPEAHNLITWYNQEGKNIPVQSISKDGSMPVGGKNEIRKTISQIKDEGLGRSDKPDWVTIKATVTFIKTSTFCYMACPLMIGDRQCSKKVTRSGNDRWVCDRCNQEFDECDYRYLLQAQIQDHTGLIWVTAFQESGEEIIGCSAKELSRLKSEDEDDNFSKILVSRLFVPFLFRLKIKEETYGEEQKVKVTVAKAEKLNNAAESRYMLNLLSKHH